MDLSVRTTLFQKYSSINRMKSDARKMSRKAFPMKLVWNHRIVLGFLQHNYPEFSGNYEDIVSALSSMSDTDTLLPRIKDEESQIMLGVCPAPLETRRFLLFNNLPIRSGPRYIWGPESYEMKCNGQEFSLPARHQLAPVMLP